MITHLRGELWEKTPTYVVVDASGIGYKCHISLNTFGKITTPLYGNCKLFTHLEIKEGSHSLWGFADAEEREIFRQLISVNGVGANTARVILSSLLPDELMQAIINNNIPALVKIKGIGDKTAKQIAISLSDKMKKLAKFSTTDSSATPLTIKFSETKDEAVSALISLGFNKGQAEKAVDNAIKKDPGLITVEDLIKQALRAVNG